MRGTCQISMLRHWCFNMYAIFLSKKIIYVYYFVSITFYVDVKTCMNSQPCIYFYLFFKYRCVTIILGLILYRIQIYELGEYLEAFTRDQESLVSVEYNKKLHELLW